MSLSVVLSCLHSDSLRELSLWIRSLNDASHDDDDDVREEPNVSMSSLHSVWWAEAETAGVECVYSACAKPGYYVGR